MSEKRPPRGGSLTLRGSHLRLVGAEEKLEPAPEPMSLDDAIDHGTYFDVLVAQRLQLLEDLKTAHAPAAKASMHRHLTQLSQEIEAMKAAAREEAEQDAEAEPEDYDPETAL